MAQPKSHKQHHQNYSAVFIALSCALLIHSAARAQSLQANGLPSNYPKTRQTAEQQQYPWRSIGSLSIAGRQFCTATLISETQVITAAHCLWNQDSEDWYPASYIHFLAGYERGQYLAHSEAASIKPNQHYQFTSPPNLESLHHDWALVTLKKPLGKTLGYIPLGRAISSNNPALAKEPLQLAGYRQDRPEVLSVAKQCLRTKARNTPAALSNFLIHSCAALSGDSGGPLLSGASSSAIKEGSVIVEAIHVGRQSSQNHSHSLAVTAESIIKTLQKN